MTPAALILARDADAAATAAATALWRSIVGHGDAGDADYVSERVEAVYAEAALDLIGQLVGSATDLPDAVLREAVVRAGMFMSNTLGPAGSFGVGLKSFRAGDGLEFEYQSEHFGSVLRRSGVSGKLLPWTRKRAGAI